ncbi:ROK family protein [Paucilactobacillus kaifaensis]|uniref:ROK family protein n=1 Tax=Paucilactobacillus kaifaensis TaxID=2559921 RepID=UPI001CC48431|nr:ROK family protein [Paucilactobacillus kaifaensis]
MFIGIDLGGTNIKVGLFDDQLQPVDEIWRATQSETNSKIVIDNMIVAVQALLTQNQLQATALKAIGIGVPGLLDIDTGISKFSPNFMNWQDVPIKQIFEDQFHVPVFIDNDVRVNLYGEWQFGAGIGQQNLLMVTLGTGLGSGVVLDGRVLYGTTASAGELGHMNMYRHGRPCACGSTGCLGRYVSARGIVKTAQEKLKDGETSILTDWTQNDPSKITAKMISEADEQHDQLAHTVWQETGELLGYGLANAINLFNPAMVIIGGGMANAGKRLLTPTKNAIKAHGLKIAVVACQVVTAKLGDRAGMMGATIVAKRRLK